MGAYYQAVLTTDKPRMYDVHSTGNGAKLMEHSFMENTYCTSIMALLRNKPAKVTWLCDYHKADEGVTSLSWDTASVDIELAVSKKLALNKLNAGYYILNHTNKTFIDMNTLKVIMALSQSYNEWLIHPIPLLCNSETSSAGGGDYHTNDSRRSTWCGHTLEVVLVKPTNGYIDITRNCMFS